MLSFSFPVKDTKYSIILFLVLHTFNYKPIPFKYSVKYVKFCKVEMI